MYKKSGIYCIKNLVDGKMYVGQTNNFARRKRDHFLSLRRNVHYNTYLQRSYNKYGRESFIFRILIYCEPFELTRHEQFFVDNHKKDLLYNICVECVDSTQGVKRDSPSEETRLKISKSLQGRIFTKTHREKLRMASSGKNNAMSGVRGKDHPLFGKVGKDAPFYGKSHTGQWKKDASLRMLGKNNPMYGKRGKEHPNYGRKLSEETKKKISLSQKKRYANMSEEEKACPEHVKKKLSKLRRGKNNPMYGTTGFDSASFGKKPNRKTSSKYVGVSFDKNSKKWYSYCQSGLDGKRIYVGQFENEVDAAIARDKVMLKEYGKDAPINIFVK